MAVAVRLWIQAWVAVPWAVALEVADLPGVLAYQKTILSMPILTRGDRDS